MKNSCVGVRCPLIKSVTRVYPRTMAKAVLYDHLGFVVGNPTVPEKPIPQIVVWGVDTYLIGCPDEAGRPQYYYTPHFVIPDTFEHLRFD